MSIEMMVVVAGASFVALLVLLLLIVKIPKPLKKAKYTERWRNVQSYCRSKDTWADAIIAADRLLDRALKQRKFKGHSPGERLVSAQRYFGNNDGVWFAHNLYKKLIATPDEVNLKEDDVKRALSNFRQALRDLGALPDGEQRNS